MHRLTFVFMLSLPLVSAVRHTWTQEDLDEMRDAYFGQLDYNGDGYVDMQEMRSSFIDGSMESALYMERHMVDLLGKIDRNKDGLVTWEEYISYFLEEEAFDEPD
ncbi:hypothetical protein FOL47_000112 [Perkinsus chesapeaki]|uniref:EF-hand domain-containing protein n=1 Tax=Perkinsus chesapeaki TaxID=330153 RepID=A0A7J6N197_PERCH|nr:hypothetical protein FOL47_000112 [Perkinsus chesapeaki]